MTKETFEKIIELLNSKKIKYEHLTHDHVHTSEDAAKVRGTKIEQAAKAIVLKIKNKKNERAFIQCVLQGSRKIDFKKLKKELNLKSVSMASAEEVLKLTNCTIGSVPPFGPMFNLETYLDEHVLSQDEIVFSAGTHNDSIKLKSRDYKELLGLKIIDVSVDK